MDQTVKTINADTLNQHIDVTADSWRLDTTDDDLSVTLGGPGGFLGVTITIAKVVADNEAVVTPLNGLIGGESSYTFTAVGSITIQSDGQFGSTGNWNIIATTNVDISPDLQIQAGDSITYSEESYAGTGSFQPVGPDLNLAATAGKNATDGTAFLAPIMGNIHGTTLTKTGNYLAGLIGADSITGTQGSHYQKGGVLGIVMDEVTAATAAVVGVIDGDSGVTTAGAAFAYRMNNSNAGSGVNYGLDLFGAVHDGYLEAAILKADLRLSKEVCIFQGAGAPTDGVTGATFAEIGSLYINRTAGTTYQNTGTKASPTWTQYVATGITNSASANVVAKSNGTNLVASGITDDATTIKVAEPIAPSVAGGQTVGTTALPFSSAFIGASATNNIQLTGTSAAARVITLPDTTLTLAEGRLASVPSVDMNTATATTLYTVPAGKTCVVTRVIVRLASTSLTTASYSFGFNSAAFDNVIANTTHTELTGATLYTVLFPKTGAAIGAAAGTLKILLNTLQGGAATTTIDVFGFTY